jgi:hypothetical protein
MAMAIFIPFLLSPFFQVAKLRSLLQISSWQMDESFDPNLSNTTSFHIYDLIKCLREYAHQPALLSADGMPLIHVKQLAQFILSWFRGMDVQYDVQSSKFDSSILGSHLIYLTHILDKHQVHTLWEQSPQALTYVWFSSVRALLHLFQQLSMATAWKINASFLQTSPSTTIDPRNRDDQHFLDMIRS